MIVEDYKSDKEKKYDAEHTWLHLDPELYYDRGWITSFLILTNDQLKQVKKWTAHNMKKYEVEVRAGGFSDEDYKRLMDEED